MRLLWPGFFSAFLCVFQRVLARESSVALAMLGLAIARLATLLPMRVHMKLCGARQREAAGLMPGQIRRAERVAYVVRRAARLVPFKAVCIEQTIAASLILRCLGVPATAYIGVHRDPAARLDPAGYNAHAWLRAGDRVVIGGPDVSDFVPLAWFA